MSIILSISTHLRPVVLGRGAGVRRVAGAPWAPPPASTRAGPSPSAPPPLSTTSSPPSVGLRFHSKNRDDTHGHYCHNIGIGMKPQPVTAKTHRCSGLARLEARRAHELVTWSPSFTFSSPLASCHGSTNQSKMKSNSQNEAEHEQREHQERT
jgi:hypothetical protein